MRQLEYTATFPAFEKWGDVADGKASFSLFDIPQDVYANTVDRLEGLRRNGKRVLDLSVSVTRDEEPDTIRVTARGITD